MRDGGGGDGDQRGALVERHDLHARRQRAVTVDLFDFRLDARRDVVGVKRAVHHHDRRHYVLFMIATGLAKPRRVADIDPGDVLTVTGTPFCWVRTMFSMSLTL